MPIKTKGAEGDSSLPDGDYGISLACSDNHVYVDTISGWCLMFPTDVNYHTVPILGEKLSCHYIRSLGVVKKTSLLWVSAGDQILFVNCSNLEFDEDKKDIMLIGGLEHFYCHLMKKLYGLCILMGTPFLHGMHKIEN